MRRLAVVFGIVLLLALCQAGQTADLQAGWYANIVGVHIYVYDLQGSPILLGDACFHSTPPGQYGPFEVTDGPYHADWERDISVPTDAHGVGPEESLIIPAWFGMSIGDRIAYLQMLVNTNYDASQMYLQMWRTHYEGGPDELIWEYKQSGPGGFNGQLQYNTTVTGDYYFQLNVVPEPDGMSCLLLGVISSLGLARLGRR